MGPGAKAGGIGSAGLVGYAAILGVGLGTSVAQYAVAQENGGPLFTIGIESKVSASDNHGLSTPATGTTFLSETVLSFGFESVTRTESLVFSFSDTLRFGDGPDAPDEAGFLGPNLSLGYDRQGANARFGLDASLTTRDLDNDLTEAEAEEATAADLTADSGTLTTQSLTLEMETGLATPVGAELSLSGTRREYSDTTDPALYDTTRVSASAALVLRPGTTTQLRPTISRSEYRADDSLRTRRITDSLSFGASHQLSSVTTLTGQLGWTRIEETWRAAGVTLPTDEGLTAALGLSHVLRNGSASVDLSHDVTSAGERTDLSLGRAFDLPTGTLDISLGISDVPDLGTRPTGSIAYRRDLPDQSLALTLSSQIDVNDDSEVERRTTLDLGYGYEISETDRLNLDLAHVWIDEAGASGTDVARTTATARYTRALTPDWDLSTGYSHRLRDEEGSATAHSNTIFFSLERDFSWRP